MLKFCIIVCFVVFIKFPVILDTWCYTAKKLYTGDIKGKHATERATFQVLKLVAKKVCNKYQTVRVGEVLFFFKSVNLFWCFASANLLFLKSVFFSSFPCAVFSETWRRILASWLLTVWSFDSSEITSLPSGLTACVLSFNDSCCSCPGNVNLGHRNSRGRVCF